MLPSPSTITVTAEVCGGIVFFFSQYNQSIWNKWEEIIDGVKETKWLDSLSSQTISILFYWMLEWCLFIIFSLWPQLMHFLNNNRYVGLEGYFASLLTPSASAFLWWIHFETLLSNCRGVKMLKHTAASYRIVKSSSYSFQFAWYQEELSSHYILCPCYFFISVKSNKLSETAWFKGLKPGNLSRKYVDIVEAQSFHSAMFAGGPRLPFAWPH